jgi:hypothetical protein
MKMKIVLEVEKLSKIHPLPNFFNFPIISIFIHYYQLLE